MYAQYMYSSCVPALGLELVGKVSQKFTPDTDNIEPFVGSAIDELVALLSITLFDQNLQTGV